MTKYEELKEKYASQLQNHMTFETFLQERLEEYFHENTIIDHLYAWRSEQSHVISDKEVEIMDKEEKLYAKLIELCGPEKKEALDELLLSLEMNRQDMVDVYAKEFYKFGIKDATSFQRNS